MIALFKPLFITITWFDIVDIILVAYLFYVLYNLIKGTVAIRIFIGIISFYFIWKIVVLLEMKLLGEILGSFISVGVIALFIVFQQEIRKFLLMIGNTNFIIKRKKRFLFWKIKFKDIAELDVDAVVEACRNMAAVKTGALIVIANQSGLREYVDSGELINSKVSTPLIENIFFKNSPLHDGAIIIHDNRIVAARCVLPISKSTTIPADYGLRHRAAVGISEISDSISIVVSEQNGQISLSTEGLLTVNVSPDILRRAILKDFTNINQ